MKKITLLYSSIATVLLFTNCSQVAFTPVQPTAASSTTSGSSSSSGSSGSSGGSSASSSGSTSTTTAGENIISVSVGCGYVNEPCVSVTICTPGTSTCQTIDNVLVDTGSYGLRLFSSAVTISLTQETTSSGLSLAECVSYVDGSSQWGPVKRADVRLGSETASDVPIEIIESGFAKIPTDCTDAEATASESGFNGILGVGLFAQDCGDDCVSYVDNQLYFSCSSANCTNSTASLDDQVTNPVSHLSQDNNGVILQLPSISYKGEVISGSLIFGIGTQANNTPSSVTTFLTDGDGNFTTTYNGSSYTAFIDSGSNAYYFPSSLTQCPSTSDYSDFYCPTSTKTLSAVQHSASGSVTETISFEIANTTSIAESDISATAELGGYLSGYFDWGLPFFFGRSVYVGIDGTSSTLGTGPYWAY